MEQAQVLIKIEPDDFDNANEYLIGDNWDSNRESVIKSIGDAIEYLRHDRDYMEDAHE